MFFFELCLMTTAAESVRGVLPDRLKKSIAGTVFAHHGYDQRFIDELDEETKNVAAPYFAS